MDLKEIYQPIADQLLQVEEFLCHCLKESQIQPILELSDYLLSSPGKRTRPAFVILCEKAASAGNGKGCDDDELIKIATAVELIHIASLVHDDVLDEATKRHNKPSANALWGTSTSIALGDYVYTKAFELIGSCKNPDVFRCISQAIYLMCEGELTHVCNRGNLYLARDNYLSIITKKTAVLFGACCQAGTIAGGHSQDIRLAMKEFGMNFGIAFQIIDDYKDIVSEAKALGKDPGQDMMIGEMTLPLLNLAEIVDDSDRANLIAALKSGSGENALGAIREMFLNSEAPAMTQKTAFSYIDQAKNKLEEFEDSEYKRSLNCLADFITVGVFSDYVR
jgi:geranylgeranyl pyrophosphate synthase